MLGSPAGSVISNTSILEPGAAGDDSIGMSCFGVHASASLSVSQISSTSSGSTLGALDGVEDFILSEAWRSD